MSKIAIWLILIMIGISLVSTLLSWWYFKRNSERLDIRFIERANRRRGVRLQLEVSLPNIFKPILGNISTRFIYDDFDLSQKFILHKKISKKFFALKPGAYSATTINLPDVREYKFKGALVFFEDLFRFFSFATYTSLKAQFSNLPKVIESNEIESTPKATDAEEIRIKTLKRIPGEWLAYKKFETSDDVKRIVWKVFAKNKELMVRKQEELNPFASHIYFYLSFYNNLSKSYFFDEHLRVMSNHYKNKSYSIYHELASQEFEVKLILDQAVNSNPNALNEIVASAEKISLCNWQKEKAVNDWYDARKGSVLFIHSLMDTDCLTELLEKCDSQTKIFYVDLAKVFESRFARNWLKYIFIKPKSDELSKLRRTWPFSPLKSILQQNQAKNISLLEASKASIEFI